MSVEQGSTPFNSAYFDSLDTRVSVTVTCDGLQRIATQAVESVAGTLNAATTQLSLVQSDAALLAQRVLTLEAHIATMVGSSGAFSALEAQSSTVGAVVDLGSAIAYIHAQAAVMVTLGVAGNLSFLKQALKLAQELIEVQTAATRLEDQIESLTALITALPARLSSLVASIAAKAGTIPNCTIS